MSGHCVGIEFYEAKVSKSVVIRGAINSTWPDEIHYHELETNFVSAAAMSWHAVSLRPI